jgi:Raf kinase inhibitor-like YbhB/YbcL family protein
MTLGCAIVSVMVSAGTLRAQTPPTQPPAAQPQPGGRGGGAARPRGIRVMTLSSTAFIDGGMIPAKHAQTGRDVSPPLTWSGAPDSTQSFVLIVHDADAAIGDGADDLLHWMVWSIPGSATSLAEGVAQGPQAANGMRQISGTGPYYRGPAAPSTGPAHHYLFELYALDVPLNVAAVGMAPPATRAAVMAAMASHIRGKGVLVGLYRRPAP